MPPFGPEGLVGALSRLGVPPAGGFAFGPYHLDPGPMRLMRDGVLVRLPTRQVTVLHALVAAGGSVLLKDHLIQVGWQQIVGDSSLEKLISELRKVLDPDNPHRYIKTVSGRGYQFVAPVTRTRPEVDITALLAPDRMWGDALAALRSFKREDLLVGRLLLEQLVDAHPDEHRFRTLLALTCALLYDSTRADPRPDTATLERAVFEAYEAVRLAPDRTETSATLGFCLERKGEHEEALTAVRRAVRLDRTNWLNHGRLATLSWGQERLDAVRDTLQLNPGFSIAYFVGATVWVARESFEESDRMVAAGVSAMEAEVASSSLFAGVGLYYLKGLLCIMRGRHAEALSALDREIELESRDLIYGRECCANAWYAKGACHLIRGDLEAARAAFLEALDRVPHHPLASAGTAIIDRRQGGKAPRPQADEATKRQGDEATSLVFEREMANAALVAHAGDVAAAVRLLDAALAAAPPGSTGWTIPIDPLLRVWENRAAWKPVLDRLALRAR